MSIIEVNHLKKYYRVHKKTEGFRGSIMSVFNRKYYDVKAVDDVSFHIDEGELVGFIGPNGAGKTTTLKCLSGLLYPSEGKVSVLGYIPNERKHEYLKKIALVMGQKNQLWWDLPAIESFNLNKILYEVSESHYKKTLDELVELLNVQDILNIQVRKLSLGQRMKCELIAALIHSPKVLFLDEPTIGLDVVMQQNLRQFIRDYNRKYKATIILTSHYMQDVEELCKRVIVINNGAILYDGPLEDIVKKYATHKLISVIFHAHVSKEKLAELGEVKEYDFPKATLSIPLDKSNMVAVKLLQDFPTSDLNIEEENINDIIAEFFRKS